MPDATAAQVAAQFHCSKRKVTDAARLHRIGYNLEGRAGYRFTEADIVQLRKAMAPPAPVEKKRTA